MGSKRNLLGQKFTRLTVISENPTRNIFGRIRWDCICDCGNKTVVTSYRLTSGHTRSCGCLQIEVRTIHGMSCMPEYNLWYSMVKRCINPNDHAYHNYGGRGITVCDRWLNSFEAFCQDMGPRPSPDHSIERKENDKGYYKNNCKWATKIEQANNRRNNVFYRYNGEQLTIPEISRRTGINKWTLEDRIDKMNLSIDQAVEYMSEKVNRDSITFNETTRSLKEWSEHLGISYQALYGRLYKMNWPIEKAFSKQ
jgi:hypothetical protein